MMITDEFSEALQLLESDEPLVFVTGNAGTGKTTLIRHFCSITGKRLAVVAPTGVAAMHAGGSTIHSFFRLRSGEGGAVKVKELDDDLYHNLDCIVIDEVSMVRADLMDTIDRFLRINGPNKFLPFGGVQIICVGDLNQLPPVVSSEAEKEMIDNVYESPFFFSSHAVKSTGMAIAFLSTVHRQQDAGFVEMLNAIRRRTLGGGVLKALNQKYIPNFKPPPHEHWVYLCSTNRSARRRNEEAMRRIDEKAATYVGKLSGSAVASKFADMATIELKKTAQVMFIKNDYENRWVNGTLGRVVRLMEDAIEVEIDGPLGKETETVEPVNFDLYSYEYDRESGRVENRVDARLTQLPVIPAYAMTIHKSQGKTIDRTIIDLGRGAFAHGQAYVAMSRCSSLDGLVFLKRLMPGDIRLDKRVREFMEIIGAEGEVVTRFDPA